MKLQRWCLILTARMYDSMYKVPPTREAPRAMLSRDFIGSPSCGHAVPMWLTLVLQTSFSRGQMVNILPKAQTINDTDRIDYLMWLKSPGKHTLLSSRMFQGLRGYLPGTIQNPSLSLECAGSEHPLSIQTCWAKLLMHIYCVILSNSSSAFAQ